MGEWRVNILVGNMMETFTFTGGLRAVIEAIEKRGYSLNNVLEIRREYNND